MWNISARYKNCAQWVLMCNAKVMRASFGATEKKCIVDEGEYLPYGVVCTINMGVLNFVRTKLFADFYESEFNRKFA
jgi:hypothetical protein